MTKISFIVIGQNQERTIRNCLGSVYTAIEESRLTHFEVIFVDSASKDNTVAIIEENFPAVILVKLTGKLNVAIAKNAGAKKAVGEIYYFIDGDITLDRDFIPQVYDFETGLHYDIVTGRLEEILYNHNWEAVGFVKDRFQGQGELGGIFLVKSEIFKAVNGFKEYMKLDEDADLQVRMAAKGNYLCRISHRIAIHHTVFYFTYQRSLKRLFNGDLFYLGVFYRENLLNRYCFKKLYKMQKTTFLLVLLILLAFAVNPAIVLCYPVLIMIKYYLSALKKCSALEYLFGKLAMDICLPIGFLLFYPKMRRLHYDTIS